MLRDIVNTLTKFGFHKAGNFLINPMGVVLNMESLMLLAVELITFFTFELT